MKRFVTILLILAVALFAFSACSDYADYPEYEYITYRESGIEFTLRNDMRRTESENYEFYFSNMTGTAVFTASELDSKTLSEVGAKENSTAGEYVDRIIAKNGFDREMIYYSHDEQRGSYSFRYSVGNEGEDGVFYYVVILGEVGNLWYVEMICAESDSGLYVDRFDSTKKTIRTYDE